MPKANIQLVIKADRKKAFMAVIKIRLLALECYLFALKNRLF